MRNEGEAILHLTPHPRRETSRQSGGSPISGHRRHGLADGDNAIKTQARVEVGSCSTRALKNCRKRLLFLLLSAPPKSGALLTTFHLAEG